VPRRRILSLLAATLLLAACTGSGRAASLVTTTTTTSPGSLAPSSSSGAPQAFTPEPISWQPCGGRLQCATLRVPLDYANPTGPTIELSVNELPARRPDERIGVLLMNPGGPGGSGLEFVAAGVALTDTVQDRFDIVGFDPRGVGASTQLQCGSQTVPAFRAVDSDPDSPDELTQLDAAAQAVADDCGTNAGDLLPHVGTDDVVRDMDTIRQALGETQINYLGISYGTLLGLRYAALFPHNARAITLDGVVDPTQGFTEFLRQQTIAFDTEIKSFLDACPSGGDCPPGGASAAYDEIAQRVESAPIPGRNGAALGPSDLAVAVLIPTYDPTARTLFYQGLTSALQGDGSVLLRIAHAYYDSAEFPLYAAVECIDSPHPVGAADYETFAKELDSLSPRVGGAIANELLPCAFWKAPVIDITGPVTAPASPPILVVGNTRDAATPYQQAVDVAKTLANGHLLTFDSAGHAAYGQSQCVARAEEKYFIDLAVPSSGATCSN